MARKPAKSLFKQLLGRWGEDLAADTLLASGYEILERNLRTPDGEIDLIALKEGTLTFVEVKTRSNHDSGYPEEAITEDKLDHMFAAAQTYLEKNPAYQDQWRMDVISITGRMGSPDPAIEWFEDVG